MLAAVKCVKCSEGRLKTRSCRMVEIVIVPAARGVRFHFKLSRRASQSLSRESD